jgi:hypothetical protein
MVMEPLELKPGIKVLHGLFGVGTVRDVSGTGPSAKVTVSFGPSVGDKKLIVGSAPLRLAENASSCQHWRERLTATCSLRQGHRLPALQAVRETLHTRASTPAFWTTVRDELRTANRPAPKVLDAPSGCVSISLHRQFEIEICIRHAEMLKPNQFVLARAVLDVLARECLREFEISNLRPEFGPGGELSDEDVIVVHDADVPHTDRAPLWKPLPVRPKGVIPNRPRRRDDY